MWLFLASEGMFFIAMLGAFIVLQSAGQQHQLFVRSSQMLSRQIGSFSVVMLILSSRAVTENRTSVKWFAVLMGLMFLMLQAVQWSFLLERHTAAAVSTDGAFVYDGIGSSDGGLVYLEKRIPLPPNFDMHAITAGDFSGPSKILAVKLKDIRQEMNYGPSRNNFFASFFLLSAVHGLHLLAGLFALVFFLIFRKGKLPPAVQNYWHFVNAVGILGFAALYFV